MPSTLFRIEKINKADYLKLKGNIEKKATPITRRGISAQVTARSLILLEYAKAQSVRLAGYLGRNV